MGALTEVSRDEEGSRSQSQSMYTESRAWALHGRVREKAEISYLKVIGGDPDTWPL